MKFLEEELKAVTIQAPVTIIVTDGSAGNVVLSRLKIHQILSDVVHIMTDITTLKIRKSEVLALWGQGTYCNVLVVEDSPDCMDVDAIVTEVAEILNSHAEKKLVVVSGETNPLASKLRDQMHCTEYNDIFKFSQLEEESQLRVLEHEVKFQGCNMSLQSLTGENYPELSADTVTQLVAEIDVIKIGEPVTPVDPTYISRTLCHKNRISMDVLHFINQPGQLAVSGMSVLELQDSVPQGMTVEIFNELHERGRMMTAPSGNTVQASDDAIEVEESECYYYVIDDEDDFMRLNSIQFISFP
jgi:hypothetical protein